MRTMLIVAVAAMLAIVVPAAAGEIHDAAVEGDAARVKELLKEDPDLAVEKDVRNETPLHVAAREGHLEVIKVVLKAGVPIDIGDNEESTALDVAAIYGHVEVAEYLLKKGAALDHADVNGLTPLHFAAYNIQPEVAALLIERGADVGAATVNGSTPLHGAAYNGDVATMTLLLENGADVNVRNGGGYTPVLSGTAANAELDAVELLVEHGADVYDREHRGSTTLMFAAAAGRLDVVRYLIDAGVSLRARNDSQWTAIHNAAERGHAEIIDILVENGADVNAKTNGGWNAVAWATIRGNREVIEHLVAHGAEIDAPGDNGLTPLVRAFRDGNAEVATILLENGADVNRRDTDWERTALHGAAVNGQTELAELALEYGIDIDAVDAAGMTALEYAARYGHREVAELLVSRGATAEGLEENYGRPELLDRTVASGEAALWYLGHCGFAVKTSDHFLIFDYWRDGEMPASASLANGRIVPSEIEDENVYVFVTHEHRDHFDEAIFEWADALDNVTYVYGFTPELVQPYRDAGYTGPEYTFVGPREHSTIDGIDIRTIAANDAGVGFLVSVDGVVLFHAGDHAGWGDEERDGFFSEIDYITEYAAGLDVAFMNVTGCHAHDPDRLKEGNLYTLTTLDPAVMVPTHALNREYEYTNAATYVAEAGFTTHVCCPMNCGDSFMYQNGKMLALAPAVGGSGATANATPPTCTP